MTMKNNANTEFSQRVSELYEIINDIVDFTDMNSLDSETVSLLWDVHDASQRLHRQATRMEIEDHFDKPFMELSFKELQEYYNLEKYDES